MATDWRVDCGDAAEWLRGLAEGHYHCCVTSPPYYGLRDYGAAGQIGLEQTPAEYVARLVEVFRGVRRALRDDGTCWVNIGDSMGKGKQIMGMPWRLAFALQADGWILRSEIIWAKKSPMPESVRDRPTKAHEQIFLLTKRPTYYYDQEAERVNGSGQTQGGLRHKYTEIGGQDWNRTKMGFGKLVGTEWTSRNLWSYWNDLSPSPVPDAHFATFAEDLPRRCLRLGTSEKGCCQRCGAPWRRVVERERKPTRPGLDTKADKYRDSPEADTTFRTKPNLDPQRHCSTSRTTGWEPSCACGEAQTVPCRVLEPFTGSGTTGVVARRLGLHFAGVELNPEYAELARRRIAGALSDVPRARGDDAAAATLFDYLDPEGNP